MFRGAPTSNKVLARKWEDRLQEIHLEKLRTMKASVDMRTPPRFRHLRSRLKKHQMMEDRFTEIERENRILLEKMSTILSTKGRESDTVRPRSLNRELRKRELLRVTVENQAILRRLQDKLPSYNVQQWEEDRRKQEDTLRLRCEYPYTSAPASYRGHSRSSTRPRASSPTSRSLATSYYVSPQKASRTITPIGFERRVVLKRGVNIGDRYFIVEISTNKRQVWVQASDVETPDCFSLLVPYQEAVESMGGSENYPELLPLLRIDNGELRLSAAK